MTRFTLFDFDQFEVHGCKEFHNVGYPSYTEQVDDAEAQFWTVYGHYSPDSGQQGIEALVDCTSRPAAEIVQRAFASLRSIITASDDITGAIEGVTDQFDAQKDALMDATSAAEKILKAGAA